MLVPWEAASFLTVLHRVSSPSSPLLLPPLSPLLLTPPPQLRSLATGPAGWGEGGRRGLPLHDAPAASSFTKGQGRGMLPWYGLASGKEQS